MTLLHLGRGNLQTRAGSLGFCVVQVLVLLHITEKLAYPSHSRLSAQRAAVRATAANARLRADFELGADGEVTWREIGSGDGDGGSDKRKERDEDGGEAHVDWCLGVEVV